MGTSTARCLNIHNISPKRNLTRCGVLEYDYLFQFSPSSVFGQKARSYGFEATVLLLIVCLSTTDYNEQRQQNHCAACIHHSSFFFVALKAQALLKKLVVEHIILSTAFDSLVMWMGG